jgi:hypothetical protein
MRRKSRSLFLQEPKPVLPAKLWRRLVWPWVLAGTLAGVGALIAFKPSDPGRPVSVFLDLLSTTLFLVAGLIEWTVHAARQRAPRNRGNRD